MAKGAFGNKVLFAVRPRRSLLCPVRGLPHLSTWMLSVEWIQRNALFSPSDERLGARLLSACNESTANSRTIGIHRPVSPCAAARTEGLRRAGERIGDTFAVAPPPILGVRCRTAVRQKWPVVRRCECVFWQLRWRGLLFPVAQGAHGRQARVRIALPVALSDVSKQSLIVLAPSNWFLHNGTRSQDSIRHGRRRSRCLHWVGASICCCTGRRDGSCCRCVFLLP